MPKARFFVARLGRDAWGGDTISVELRQSGRGPENAEMGRANSVGTLNLYVASKAAAAWFNQRLGRDILLTLEDAPLKCPICGLDTSENDSSTVNGVTIHEQCRTPTVRDKLAEGVTHTSSLRAAYRRDKPAKKKTKKK